MDGFNWDDDEEILEHFGFDDGETEFEKFGKRPKFDDAQRSFHKDRGDRKLRDLKRNTRVV